MRDIEALLVYRTYFVFLFMILTFMPVGQAQCNSLRNLINSNLTSSEKGSAIDSLINNLIDQKSDSLADCYHDLGYRWYYKNWVANKSTSDIENAVKYTKMAIKVRKEADNFDTLSLRQSMYNLAFFFKAAGDIYKSKHAYRDIISLSLNDEKENYAKNHLGLILIGMGDFSEALNLFKDVVRFSIKKEDMSELLLLAYINISDCYAAMGYIENKDSLDHYVKLGQNLIMKRGMESTYKSVQLKILEGNLNLELERYDEGIKLYQQLIKSEYDEEQIPEIVYNNLGFCQLRAGDTLNSKISLLKSIELNSKFSYPYENLGDLSLKRREFRKGMAYYQKAIDLVIGREGNKTQGLPSPEELEFTQDKLSLLNHMTTMAKGWIEYYKAETKKDYLINALATFEKADQLIDIIKSENTEFKSKLYWREQSAKLYVRAIEVSYLLNRPEEAYYFMERNKALLLLEDLTNEEAKEIARIPEQEAQKEFELKRAIFLSENNLQQLSNEIPHDSLTAIKHTIRSQKYAYERFLDSLEKNYPQYAKFKKKIDFLALDDYRTEYLTDNKASLHYILNEKDGYGLLTTTDTLALFQLDYINQLHKDLKQLRTYLSSGISDIHTLNTISNRLFNILMPKELFDHVKGKQLTIIPDYTLQQIPFETLVTNSTNLDYLFKQVEIGYAYSISLNHFNQNNRKETSANLLGIAPIHFTLLNLPELYFSKDEVRSVASIFPGQTLFNEKASKSNFMANADHHNILHLATHADIGDGENPWVAFSDSKMYLKEIYAIKNHADMVVLSGCNTSSGEVMNGEGVMSLARGFFYAGAKSVVSTLWPIADEAGKDILVNFYNNLNQGLTKSTALQKAKLDYLANTKEEELKHPYYWAGFIVLGDNSPVSNKPISPWLFTGLGLLGIGILAFGFKKIRALRAVA
ncbi:CHAT domain-containing protein [Pareuzebyella sediminis]|uniref:CHAT domain-containing protein n=1 Tax=Pareuzebyella sediminis TaxID=2607998 RepID=UPI0018E13410|nr:CHAT domain-containing protein [Pareuzebyella sediminis]